MLLVSVLAGLVLYDGQLSRLDGLFLLALALLWLLFTIKIARLAERQGSDSLTREQLAELPRERIAAGRSALVRGRDDCHAHGYPYGGG
ncbi:inner membrane protein YrbG [Klebsiella aerogenes]|nr:inner membrane protein YrbG [Klebsiella aerogenes]